MMAETGLAKAKLRFQSMKLTYRQCKQFLFVLDPESELEAVKARMGEWTPRTWEWFLQEEAFLKWSRPEYQRRHVLGLVGLPVSCKTIISTFLVDHLKEKMRSKPEAVLTYHFCGSENDSISTPLAVVKVLLYQSIKHRPRECLRILRNGATYRGRRYSKTFRVVDASGSSY